jgi:acyl-CoA thioesterase FadM
MIFTKRYPYRFGDIDDARIAYYPKLLHYFHCCFEDWWGEGMGVPYHRVMHEEHLGLPAVNLAVDFVRPVRYGDQVDISLGVLRLGNSSVQLGMWMAAVRDQPDGNGQPQLACRARITTAAVDMRTMASQPLPAVWRQRMTRFLLAAGEFPDASAGRGS